MPTIMPPNPEKWGLLYFKLHLRRFFISTGTTRPGCPQPGALIWSPKSEMSEQARKRERIDLLCWSRNHLFIITYIIWHLLWAFVFTTTTYRLCTTQPSKVQCFLNPQTSPHAPIDCMEGGITWFRAYRIIVSWTGWTAATNWCGILITAPDLGCASRLDW